MSTLAKREEGYRLRGDDRQGPQIITTQIATQVTTEGYISRAMKVYVSD
jgi:hypothetical protein